MICVEYLSVAVGSEPFLEPFVREVTSLCIPMRRDGHGAIKKALNDLLEVLNVTILTRPEIHSHIVVTVVRVLGPTCPSARK